MNKTKETSKAVEKRIMGFYSFDQADYEFRSVRDGEGKVYVAKLFEAGSNSCSTMAMLVIPPNSGVGDHSHELTDEETYVIISGTGEMTLNNEKRIVKAGDVIINPPGGTHGLKNVGTDELKVVAIDIPV